MARVVTAKYRDGGGVGLIGERRVSVFFVTNHHDQRNGGMGVSILPNIVLFGTTLNFQLDSYTLRDRSPLIFH